MPDDDVVVAEVEADPIDAPNPIADFLKSVEDQNFVGAESQFKDMVNDRLQDAMDQAKVKIASNLYGDGEEEDEEEVELEPDVEDVEDASEPEEDHEEESDGDEV
mgnify:CR=1 FL=1